MFTVCLTTMMVAENEPTCTTSGVNSVTDKSVKSNQDYDISFCLAT